MPWQEFLLDAACRTDVNGKWMHRTVLSVCARQSGKSLVTAARILAGLMLFDERLVIGSSQNRDVGMEAWRIAVDIADEADLPIMRVKRSNGHEELVLETENGIQVRYKVVTATSGSARGLSADLVVLDELREHRAWGAWSALDKCRRARPNSQTWCITTEGDHTSVVLESLQNQARQAIATEEPGPIGYFEWSADPNLEPDDPVAWAQANPGLGHVIDVETLAAEQKTDPTSVFECEVLCRRVRTVAPSWLPSGGWARCVDSSTVPDGAQGLVFGLDAGPALDSAAIAVGWARPDGRTHCEAVGTWDGPGSTVDAERRLHDLIVRWSPKAVTVLARGSMEAVASRVGAATGVQVVAVNGADMDRATRAFLSAVVARRLVHPPDPVLASHLDAAAASEPGLFVWKRRGPLPIDAAVGAVLAVWGVEHDPQPAYRWVAY